MAQPVNDHALDVLFRDARSQNGFLNKAVPQVLVRAVYDLAKMGPTSANCSPARFLFVHTPAAKARLLPLLSEGNREKTAQAPWTVIMANDLAFQEKMPKLFPHNPGARDWFNHNRDETAMRNGTLQTAYFLISARAIGLDCGPMSGFDMAGVNREFFESEDGEMQHWRANWICNLGYGDRAGIFARSPRLEFDEACRIL
ncbi:MAG: malonic semialdehyde reductase [Hyphomonas sp.]